MKLNTKINKLCEKFVPPEEDKEDGEDILEVRKKKRENAKKRYISYKCRKEIRDNLPDGENESGDTNLSEAQITQLKNIAEEASGDFQKIEDIYKKLLEYNNNNRLDLGQKIIPFLEANPHLNIGQRNDPFLVRSEFIWDIMWAILSLDSRWLKSEYRDDLEEIVDRRLRKIEIMRYYVQSNFNKRPIHNGELYKLHKSNLLKFIYPHYIGSNVEIGGLGYNYWEVSNPEDNKPVQGFLLKEFHIEPRNLDHIEPAKAIKSIFKPLDEDNGWNWKHDCTRHLCDYVIHILHLDELVDHLMRKHNNDINKVDKELRDDIKEHPVDGKRIAILPSFKHAGRKDSENEIHYGAIAAGGDGDPYFEKKLVRFDEIIPGDHFILKSHPAYLGFSSGVYRIENALITGFLGIKVPKDFQVQGNGIGPTRFGLMQKILVKDFQTELKKAQNLIKSKNLQRNWNSPINQLGQPYLYYSSGIPYILKKNDVDPFYGTIEFRNEFFDNSDNGLGAFWGRWLLQHNLLKKIIELRFGDISGKSFKKYWYEYKTDNGDPYRFWELPYIFRIEINGNELTLIGYNLSKEKISAVYFVSHPQRQFDPEKEDDLHCGYSANNGQSLFVQIAKWDIDGSQQESFIIREHLIDTPDMTALKLTIPPNFPSTSHYWRPVIRISLELRTSRQEVTPPNLNLDIRAECAFKWPQPNDGSVDLIGHTTGAPNQFFSFFNVAYFPLFRKTVRGRYIPITFSLPKMVGGLLTFYQEHKPEHKITVIRPKMPEWFNEPGGND